MVRQHDGVGGQCTTGGLCWEGRHLEAGSGRQHFRAAQVRGLHCGRRESQAVDLAAGGMHLGDDLPRDVPHMAVKLGLRLLNFLCAGSLHKKKIVESWLLTFVLSRSLGVPELL